MEPIHLSRLVFDLRHPQARRDVADPGRLHALIVIVCGDRPRRDTRTLHRLEDLDTPNPSLLIQSAVAPDWTVPSDGRARSIQSKDIAATLASLQPGRVVRFRLRASPTRGRVGSKPVAVSGTPDALMAWLVSRRQFSGVNRAADVVTARCCPEPWASFRRPGCEDRVTLPSALFEGLLRVVDPDMLRQVVVSGVGRGRAYGFGLLSLAG